MKNPKIKELYEFENKNVDFFQEELRILEYNTRNKTKFRKLTDDQLLDHNYYKKDRSIALAEISYRKKMERLKELQEIGIKGYIVLEYLTKSIPEIKTKETNSNNKPDNLENLSKEMDFLLDKALIMIKKEEVFGSSVVKVLERFINRTTKLIYGDVNKNVEQKLNLDKVVNKKVNKYSY